MGRRIDQIIILSFGGGFHKFFGDAYRDVKVGDLAVVALAVYKIEYIGMVNP